MARDTIPREFLSRKVLQLELHQVRAILLDQRKASVQVSLQLRDSLDSGHDTSINFGLLGLLLGTAFFLVILNT